MDRYISQQDWPIEEYRSLMKEVLHNREKQSQAFLYGLIASGALLGFATSSSTNLPYLIFLLPVIILLPVSLIIITLRNATDRIEAYVRVRFALSEATSSYVSHIHKFRWPLGIASYIPVFKLMVYANLVLSLACIVITTYLLFSTGKELEVGAIVLCSLTFIATVMVAVFLIGSDWSCNPQRLEKVWRHVLTAE